MIGLVLAAGAGRRLRPDTDGLPKALLPVAAGSHDPRHRPAQPGSHRPDRHRGGGRARGGGDRGPGGRPGAGPWGDADAGAQRPCPGLEQRLLAVAGARVPARRRAAGQRRHRAPGERGEDAPRRPRRGRGDHRDRRRQAARRRGDEGRARQAAGCCGRSASRWTRRARTASTSAPPSSRPRPPGRSPTRWRPPGGATPAGTTRTAIRNSPTGAAEIAAAPIGDAVDWVEVDNHADLRRAREIAAHC